MTIGEDARGGKTRGDRRAADHDRGCEEKYVPFGVVDEDSGRLPLTFGSSFKTSDFIVESLEDGWKDLPEEGRAQLTQIHLKVDNGPESRGVRTQFLKRRVDFADQTGKIIHLLDYPP